MSEESIPELTTAAIPLQTPTLRVDERIARGKALRGKAPRAAPAE